MKFIRILKKKLPVIIAVLVILICAGLIAESLFVYFDGANDTIYSREIAKKALKHFIAPVILLFVLILLAVIWHIPNKQKIFPKGKFFKQQTAYQKKNFTIKGYLIIYLAALVLVIAGIWNGGLNDVLVKAINICTECIGLG